MPLRQIIPTPYTCDVYPIQENPKNSLGNTTRSNATTPVQRSLQSIHVFDTGERIDPAYVDRVVTHLRIMVPDPRIWKDGDQLVIPNMGKYQVHADPAPRDMGPLTQFNYLLGGKIFAKRVN